MTTPWIGIGLRSQHAHEIEAAPRALDWFEILSENHFGASGARRRLLERVRAEVPVAMHGVALSIAGSDPLSTPYLDSLRALADWLEPAFVSDHLCWTGFGGHESHDLLPVSYTESVLDHVVARVGAVQERLGRRVFLENPSAYVTFRDDAMDEAAFFAALCRRSGCGMLLDVNNLYVNAANLGIDAAAYLATIPPEAVGYLHIAGHAVLEDVRIDTHDAAVPDPVWDLYAAAVRRFPHAPVILERDDHIPPFAELVAEAEQARERHVAARTLKTGDAPSSVAPPRAVAATPGATSWPCVQKEFFERLADKPLGFAHGSVGSEHGGLDALLDDARPVRAARGMRVYSDAYTAGLRRALATNFGTLARVLRADDFDALAAAYLRAHPPRGHDFTALGAALPAFVRRFPLAASYGVERDALADVAALEQAQLEVQAAPDEPNALGVEALAALAPDAWDGLRVRFARSLRIVRATHDVLPALEAVARGEDPARPMSGAVAYLVQRGAIGVRTERIDPHEAALLESLHAGDPFAAACRAAARDGDDEAALAERGVRALVAMIERGLVTALDAD